MEFWQKNWDKLRKNTIVWLLLAGIVILFCTTWYDTFTPQVDNLSEKTRENQVSNTLNLAKEEEEKKLENELVAILSQVEGVGKIMVKVNLESGKQYQYAYNQNKEKNIVEEKDQQGGSRITTGVKEGEEMVIVQDNQTGSQKPVILKELRPAVKGVMVVAQGAEDSLLKSSLLEAVQTVLEIPAYKVTVLPMKG